MSPRRVWLPSVFCLSLTACVTGGVQNDVASETPAAVPPGPGEEAAISTVVPENNEWQNSLAASLDDIEMKGEQFLELTFNLYDRLLVREQALTQDERVTIDRQLNESLVKYNELVRAVNGLKA